MGVGVEWTLWDGAAEEQSSNLAVQQASAVEVQRQ